MKVYLVFFDSGSEEERAVLDSIWDSLDLAQLRLQKIEKKFIDSWVDEFDMNALTDRGVTVV